MPRNLTRSATAHVTSREPQGFTERGAAEGSVVPAEPSGTSAVASAVDSVRHEIGRLIELQELLQFAEVDLADREDSLRRSTGNHEAWRCKHFERIQRYRSLRNKLRDTLARENSESKDLRTENETLRSQLSETLAMLESARDAGSLAASEHQTELVHLREQLKSSEDCLAKSETRCSASKADLEHLKRELDEACEQIIRLEGQLEEALANRNSDCADIEQLAELEKNLSIAQDENETLRLRCRELVNENHELADEIAELRISKPVPATASLPMESMSWEQRKAAILEQLQREESGGGLAAGESSSIRQMLSKTESEITRRDEEIAELRELLEQQSSTIHATNAGDEVAIGAAGIAMMFDTDALIQEERDRLKEIQAEWEEKLRQAEVELSLERAKLARGRRELEQKQSDLEDRLKQLERDCPAELRQDSDKTPRRRWFKQLGLSDGS